MWRNRTVQALLREATRREQQLQAQNEKLLDRLMHMADKPWEPAPVDLSVRELEPSDFVYPDQVLIDG